jgi:hypothetical protein
VQELVEKWRQQTKAIHERWLNDEGSWLFREEKMLAQCADELAACLAAEGEQQDDELLESLKAEGQKDVWIEMLSAALRSIVVAAGAPEDWEGSVAEARAYLNTRFVETQAELDALRLRLAAEGEEEPPTGPAGATPEPTSRGAAPSP